jgi:thiol-disulfide isomerase/thioredoxin
MSTTLQLPVEGVLPPLGAATTWLNSEQLTDSELLGRPVLVEFWTFTCINWIRTLPYVRAWSDKYRADGLVVIGVHTPKFAVERNIDHIKRAAEAMRIAFPIAVDSDYAIWQAFGNQYWPTLYFIDKDGQIRHHRFGEGEYEYSEIVIQRLLAAAGAADVTRELSSVDPQGVELPADWDNLRTPETYVGYNRAENFASPDGLVADERRVYELPAQLRLNEWALLGDWTVAPPAPGVGLSRSTRRSPALGLVTSLAKASALPRTPLETATNEANVRSSSSGGGDDHLGSPARKAEYPAERGQTVLCAQAHEQQRAARTGRHWAPVLERVLRGLKTSQRP